MSVTGIRKEVFTALHKNPVLETVWASMERRGYEVQLPCGAHLFVSLNYYRRVRSVLQDHVLRAHHVLVYEPLLSIVHETIKSLPCSYNVKVSDITVLAYLGKGSIYHVDRTFIAIPSEFRDARSVTQSTTEVRCHKRQRGVGNPRRALDIWT